MKKIIVVSGLLAAGKSTFALSLSQRFQIPCFIKDNLKIAICRQVELTSRAEKSRFSSVTFDAMMYVAEQLMQCGYPLILEGNFVPAGIKKTDEAGEIQALIDRYGYDALNVAFSGEMRVLHERFMKREETDERGAANKMDGGISCEAFERICRTLNAFALSGERLEIDATDFAKVDWERQLEIVETFLKRES